jgi:hypothetical protein
LTVIAAIEAVAIVAIVIAFLQHIRSLEREAARERRLLADRIQRPEVIPAREAPQFVVPVREDDELNTVGRLRPSDSFLRGEDD